MRKTLSLALAIIFFSVSGATQSDATQSEAPGQNTLSLDERLGADDGAALAILFGANMRGNLDLCDCNYPRGGIARRVGYVEAFKKKFKETPVVQVEGGSFFFGSMGYPMADLRNEQTALAYSRFPADVVNLGRDDLGYARKLLAREGFSDRAQKLPMIRNLISANGVFGPEALAPPPYLIKEVAGPRVYAGKKSLKIGFVGVAAPNNPGAGTRDGTVTDMFAAATAAVIKARKECDVLMLVAHCDLDNALKLAQENLEVDVVIAADSGGIYNPRRVGNTLVVSAAPGNIREGDLRIYFEKDGQISYKFRSNDLDVLVPVDPAAEAFAESARKERDRIVR